MYFSYYFCLFVKVCFIKYFMSIIYFFSFHLISIIYLQLHQVSAAFQSCHLQVDNVQILALQFLLEAPEPERIKFTESIHTLV